MERGDSKCRVFAAKLLSNIVTANDVSAIIVSDAVGLSPSSTEVWSKIHSTLSTDHSTEISTSITISSTWVEMIVLSARARTREALAGVTAALYNCTVALPNDNQLRFAGRIASDTILMSTLLRQIIPVNTIKLALESSKDDKDDTWDTATDWIFLVLSRLFNWGLLSTMYRTVGPGDRTSRMVLPEQNVLLHCAAHEAQSFVDSNISFNGEKPNPFGGELGQAAVIESYVFLVDLFCRLSIGSSAVDDTDAQLSTSAALSSIDIISTSLGVDCKQSDQLREHLGANTELIRRSALILGTLVDELSRRSAGVKARDLMLSSEEQQWMLSLVRLLGNISYNCRDNQDRIRNTLVPPRSISTSTTETVHTAVVETRNALHVLLSCTSFATSCFTLREWGVIAIRNILRDNDENQAVVAALHAQNPVQSTVLEEAGIRVKLDQDGKVALSTIRENDV
jgi:hypothetical protein